MIITRKTIICILVIFVIASIPTHLIASYSSKNKIELQLETQKLLGELEGFIYSTQETKALFTTSNKKAIDTYTERYCLLNKLLIQLNENRDEWEKKIKESNNDKVYRLYLAAVQTALYSVYSRPYKYIGFLKLLEHSKFTCTPSSEIGTIGLVKLTEPLKLTISTSSEIEIQSYDEIAKDWEIKAELINLQAHYNIDKALTLNKYYNDGLILKAQLYSLEGQLDQSLSIFNNIDPECKENSENILNVDSKKNAFCKVVPSLLFCWKAYIEFKKGNIEKGKDLLRFAIAHSSPSNYSKWASIYLKSLISAKSNWIEYDFPDFIPLGDIDLETLKENSSNAISKINQQLKIPLEEIPEYPNIEKLISLAKSPESNIFWTIDTDNSRQNLQKYSDHIEKLYQEGISLEYCIEKWNQLAEKNNKKAYYYLLQKSYCSLSLCNLAEKTKTLLKNEILIKMLNYGQISGKDKKVDYRAKCDKWSGELRKALEKDIKKILSQKPDFIYAQVLDFEFHALFSSPQEASSKLEKISEELRKRHIKSLPIFPQMNTIDSLSYLYAWRSFLALMEGKSQSALEYIQKIGNKFNDWKQTQEKFIQIKNMTTNQLIEKRRIN